MLTPSGPPHAADLCPGAGRVDRLRRALDRAERDFVADVVADGGIDCWRRRLEGRFRAARDALSGPGIPAGPRAPGTAAGRAGPGGPGVSWAESAALVVALADRAVRDRVWRQLDADPDRRWLLLWRHLARRALPPYRTEPLFLLAWTAWRLGDPATVRAALGCARVQDPGHRASVLLNRMLTAGTDPRLLPSLGPRPTQETVR
ncbi:MAG: DUF4192 family protein [Mycobacteriales bacterium]